MSTTKTRAGSPEASTVGAWPLGWEECYSLRTNDGTGRGRDIDWTVIVSPEAGGIITRRVCRDGQAWDGDEAPTPDRVIWPAWTLAVQDRDQPAVPLDRLQEYWQTAGERLRDSAKWMATVIGTALAALVGTSPLRDMQTHPPQEAAVAFGATGLTLLTVTLLLVLQVMRPVSVSYNDVQTSDAPNRRQLPWSSHPLRRWKHTVETQEDLYLPCGIKDLTALRQAMIVEELTLTTLVRAVPKAAEQGADIQLLRQAQHARARRLRELRQAAGQIATIGEYYRTKHRSAWATYLGGLLGVLATAAIIAAFAWPAGT